MFYNLNFIITNNCNSKCTNCNIWKNKERRDISLVEIDKLFNLKEFLNVTDLGISGGEPFIRNDLLECFDVIANRLVNLHTIFITTNGLYHERALAFCNKICELGYELNIGVSIDGNLETNKSIRGVDSYHSAVKLLSDIKIRCPKAKPSISFTICDKNCNEDNFEHITNLSKTIGCDLTFRIAENANYYHNDSMDFALTDNQMNLVRSLFGKYKNEDKFMNEALKFYNTGISEIMYDYDKNMPICGAGKDFAFIQSNGDIFPCIYSSIKIGDLNGFNDNYLFDYHVTPKCPCMTECAVWPTIIRNERNGKQSIK